MADPLLDLQTAHPVVPQPLPPLFRYLFLLLVLGIFSVLLLWGTNELSLHGIQGNSESLRREIQLQQTDLNKQIEQIASIARNRERADDLGQWLRVSLSAQPVLTAIIEGLPEEISIRNFILQLSEGQAQISNLEVTLIGDGRAINRQIDIITQRFQNAGLQLVSPDPSLVEGGVRFRGRYLFDSPDKIRW